MKEILAMMHHLSQPEYVHVLLNPMPLYGMAAGAFLLVWSRLLHPEEFPEGALIWIILVAFVTGLAVYFGEQGYENVGAIADAHGNRWLAHHKEQAETLMYIFYLTGFCALGSLWAQRRRSPSARHWVSLTLVLSLLSMGAASWISHAGGQVMHAESR
jgi:hypothetical protein